MKRVGLRTLFLSLIVLGVYGGVVVALTQETPATKVTLPTLPPKSVLYPGVYDEEGCLRLAPDEGGRVCPPAHGVASLAHDPRVSANLKGFRGPHYTDTVTGQGIVLLHDTLNYATAGNWSVAGLVRNESLRDAGVVTVTATLLDSAGTVIEKVSAQAPVVGLRPGEPSPFVVRSQVPVHQVAKVEWLVDEQPLRTPVTRDFLVQTYYQLPYGVATVRGKARQDAPYPYVLAAGFRNLGRPVSNPRLVAAWLDEQGRVLWVESASLADGFVSTIDKDGIALFDQVKVSDPAIAGKLIDQTLMLWVMGE